MSVLQDSMPRAKVLGNYNGKFGEHLDDLGTNNTRH